MVSTEQNAHEQALGRIIARCWADAAFKSRLLADPMGVLQAEGMPVPPGVQLKVVEDTAQCMHWILPARPADLSDDVLAQVAGGVYQEVDVAEALRTSEQMTRQALEQARQAINAAIAASQNPGRSARF